MVKCVFQDLVIANISLPSSVFKRFFYSRRDKREDLISVGYLSLVEAAKLFVEEYSERDIPFRLFAWVRVKSAMVKYLAEDKPIRIPYSAQRAMANGRSPFTAQIQAASRIQSADGCIDCLAYPEPLEPFDDWNLFDLANLTSLERQVIQLRYGIGTYSHSKSEVAEKLGLSMVRVQTIRNYAMKKLCKAKAMEAV